MKAQLTCKSCGNAWSIHSEPRLLSSITCGACGSSVAIKRRIVPAGTFLAIICSAMSMMKGIIRMNVNTSSAIRNGGMISRITYRSMMRISLDYPPPSHFVPWRDGLRQAW